MKFSIVIPCRNEAKFIAGCIESIINNGDNHNNLEIFVADGLSTDGTDEIIKSYSNKYSFVHYIENHKKFTPYGLNLGIKKSSGDIIMILGAHSELMPGYIDKCTELFREIPEADCIGGYVEHIPENPVTATIAKAMSHPFGVGNAHFRTGKFEGFVDTVAFGAFKKEVFEKIGLFDESLTRNQDDEFSYRMIKNGMKIYLSMQIKTKYFVRSSVKKLYKQYYQYGYWKVYVNVKHRIITTLRQTVPPAFVFFLFVGLILSLVFSILMWAYIPIVALYFIAALISSFSIGSNFREFLTLPLIFFLLHFSYGAGYLAGIPRFIVFRKKPSSSQNELTR